MRRRCKCSMRRSRGMWGSRARLSGEPPHLTLSHTFLTDNDDSSFFTDIHQILFTLSYFAFRPVATDYHPPLLFMSTSHLFQDWTKGSAGLDGIDFDYGLCFRTWTFTGYFVLYISQIELN